MLKSPDKKKVVRQSTIGFVDVNDNCVTERKGGRLKRVQRKVYINGRNC